ncbi:MAG: hypothetical protein H6679_00395 [Epsilonproteobacteria bacterium]|nr:hypothetical protein [Campylobacterota bacterium]
MNYSRLTKSIVHLLSMLLCLSTAAHAALTQPAMPVIASYNKQTHPQQTIKYGDVINIRHAYCKVQLDGSSKKTFDSGNREVFGLDGSDNMHSFVVHGPHGSAADYQKGEPVKHGHIIRLEPYDSNAFLTANLNVSSPDEFGPEVSCAAGSSKACDWMVLMSKDGMAHTPAAAGSALTTHDNFSLYHVASSKNEDSKTTSGKMFLTWVPNTVYQTGDGSMGHVISMGDQESHWFVKSLYGQDETPDVDEPEGQQVSVAKPVISGEGPAIRIIAEEKDRDATQPLVRRERRRPGRTRTIERKYGRKGTGRTRGARSGAGMSSRRDRRAERATRTSTARKDRRTEQRAKYQDYLESKGR